MERCKKKKGEVLSEKYLKGAKSMYNTIYVNEKHKPYISYNTHIYKFKGIYCRT